MVESKTNARSVYMMYKEEYEAYHNIESIKSNKRLLSDAAKLAGQIGVSCPKEWSQGKNEEKLLNIKVTILL